MGQGGTCQCLRPFTWLLFQVGPSDRLLTLVLVDAFHYSWGAQFKETPNFQRLEWNAKCYSAQHILLILHILHSTDLLIPNNPLGRHGLHYYSHFSREKTETQIGKASCLRPHSKEMAEKSGLLRVSLKLSALCQGCFPSHLHSKCKARCGFLLLHYWSSSGEGSVEEMGCGGWRSPWISWGSLQGALFPISPSLLESPLLDLQVAHYIVYSSLSVVIHPGIQRPLWHSSGHNKTALLWTIHRLQLPCMVYCYLSSSVTLGEEGSWPLLSISSLGI